ncbi:MAG TPA: HD domain-containing phosphohydrolase [Vicinamibacterales bacterium]|nr:HD domain-containing phosphohydrolase [Vicinamibacterales bacterium]
MHLASSLSPSVTGSADAGRGRSILVVDDEDSVRELLIRWLEASGYVVVAARSAEEALARLEVNPAAVVLCDIRMPGHDGLWLAARVRQRFPETAVIMATGVQDVEASIESMRQGVVDYLTKPFGRDRLRDAVARGVEWHQAAWDARRWRHALECEMDGLRVRLHDALHAVPIGSDEELDAMLAAVMGAAGDMLAHARRVADAGVSLGRALEVGDAAVPVLRRAALLHEFGKLALPQAILRKPAPLTPEELALVRMAPQIAADMLAPVPFLAAVAPIVREVHERIDGHGYPRRLRGEQVSLCARIISVADAFDTLTHPRVYRDAISPAEARLELQRCAGTHFHPDVVAAFCASR